jgi:hypothetical protein
MSKLSDFLKAQVSPANPAKPAKPAKPANSVERISTFSDFSSGVSENSLLSDDLSASLSPIQETAREQVLAQLEANPTVQRAFVNRFNEDGTMVVTLAIRGVGTGELLIPAARFSRESLDDFGVLLECIEATP